MAEAVERRKRQFQSRLPRYHLSRAACLDIIFDESTSTTLTNVAKGEHAFYAKASNEDATPAELAFSVDAQDCSLFSHEGGR